MVMDKEGNPLVAVSERRDELMRCTAIIGWSWQKVADRLDMTMAGALQIKNCKVGIADSDLRWLQELAAMMETMPRPAVANDADNPELARLAAPVAMTVGVSEHEAQKMAVESGVLQVQAERDRTARVLADVYVATESLEGTTPEQQSAARWAVAEIASGLGLLGQVQAILKAGAPAPLPPAPVERMMREPFEAAA